MCVFCFFIKKLRIKIIQKNGDYYYKKYRDVAPSNGALFCARSLVCFQ